MLPPLLKSALRTATRLVFPDGAPPVETADPAWAPPVLAPDQLRAAAAAIAEYEAFLAPIDPGRLALLVTALLEHWYVADADPAVDRIVGADWIEALKRFPEKTIVAARREWLDAHSKRPLPADIAAICRRLAGPHQAALDCLKRAADPQEQQRARARRDERRAEAQREAERAAFVAANPGWRPFEDALRRVLAQQGQGQGQGDADG